MIGCDVSLSLGGISGVGPEKVWSATGMISYAEELSKLSNRKDVALKYNQQLLNTLVDAIVHEPTNELSEAGHTYLLSEPLRLPAYLDVKQTLNHKG